MTPRTMTVKRPVPTAREYVLSPAQLVLEAQRFIDLCETANPGPTFGHVDIDQGTVARWPGAMWTLLARPGHGKTMMLKHLARREAERIMAAGTENEECVVFATLEEPASHIVLDLWRHKGEGATLAQLWSRDFDGAAEKARTIQGVRWPVWVVQQRPVSIEGVPYVGHPLSIERTYEAIASIYEDHGLKPTLVCIDYLQLMRAERRRYGDRDRQALVSAAAEMTKELALQLSTVVAVGVQASRDADKRAVPIPTLADCQWSSSIEQTSDLIMAQWRPQKTIEDTKEERPFVDFGGDRWPVNDQLMAIRRLKQRGGPGHGTFAAWMDPTEGVLRAPFKPGREPAEGVNW